MKSLTLSLFAVVCAPVTLLAEIYADFTVSQPSGVLGTFRARIDFDKVPRVAANFIGLATGERDWIDPANGAVRRGVKYYDGIVFHRLEHNFVIQGGDPLGTGRGGPGYVFQDEFDPTLRHGSGYALSMAHAGVNTNGSQFFITLGEAGFLDDRHSVFGEVIDHPDFPNSRQLIDNFKNATVFPTTDSIPQETITIDSINIVRTVDDPAAQAFDVNDPAHGLPTIKVVDLTPTTDLAASPPTLNLDWTAGAPITEVAFWVGGDLTDPFLFQQNTLLRDVAGDESFLISGVPTDRFFAKAVEVTYPNFPNAPADVVSNGGSVAVFRTGSEDEGLNFTMTFDGNGGGTYTDLTGTTGTLSGVTYSDVAPATGSFFAQASQMRLVPQATLNVTVNPAINGRTNFIFQMNFFTETTGRFNINDATNWRGTFTYTPAP